MVRMIEKGMCEAMGKKKLFNIIKNKGQYWLVDQIKIPETTHQEYLDEFLKLLNIWETDDSGFMSVLMDPAFENNMINAGFEKVSTIVEFTRQLQLTDNDDKVINTHCLDEGDMTDQRFGQLYELCRSGSANKNKEQTIQQVMQSLRQELGENWRSNCFIFTFHNAVIGLSIPHIEMGTVDEGRLFYFGVVPEFRGQGFGKRIHWKSLILLKNMRAYYYVGSTDEANKPMIGIFKNNGCKLRDRKGIYQIKND